MTFSFESAAYNRIYGRREDAESVNKHHRTNPARWTVDHPSAIGQFLVMLGHALARNSYA